MGKRKPIIRQTVIQPGRHRPAGTTPHPDGNGREAKVEYAKHQDDGLLIYVSFPDIKYKRIVCLYPDEYEIVKGEVVATPPSTTEGVFVGGSRSRAQDIRMATAGRRSFSRWLRTGKGPRY